MEVAHMVFLEAEGSGGAARAAMKERRNVASALYSYINVNRNRACIEIK